MDNPAVQQVHGFSGRHLTPTPQRQAAFVGAALGAAAVMRLPPGIQARMLNLGVKAYAAAVAMGDAYPALGPNYKFGIRFGGTGEVTTLAKAIPFTQMYGIGPKYTPWPDFGFGLTAVPNTSSRWVYENNKSRPGEHNGRTSRVAGPLQTGKSMPGASATNGEVMADLSTGKRVAERTPARRRSRRTSSKPPAPGRGVMKSRRPYCRTHKTRHWCYITRKR